MLILQIEEYKDFINKAKQNGFINTKYMFINPFRTKTKKIEFKMLMMKLYSMTKWAKNLTKNERFRLVKHNIDERSYWCPVCGTPRAYNTSKSRWLLTCGSKDGNHINYINKEAHIKWRDGFLSKYGVTAPARLSQVKKAMQDTCKAKYGVVNPFQAEEFEAKRKEFFLRNNGVEHQMQLDKTKESIKKTCLERYGVDSYTKTEECKLKMKMTNQARYGVPYSNQKNYINPELWDASFITKIFLTEDRLNMRRGAKTLNCSRTTAYKILKTFDIQYKKRTGNSAPEAEIIDFIKELDPDTEVVQGDRNIIKPKELDIYLPEYNLAVEYNGLMFHSQGISKYGIFNTPTKDRNMHLSKTEACEAQGIQLLHIFENEWLDPNKKEIWKSIIRNKLKKNLNKIGARKCILIGPSSSKREYNQLLKESTIFFKDSHLQGSGAIGPYRYGLYYEDKLVSCMTFGNSRFHKHKIYELVRFGNLKDCSIIGAASRLLKAFRREHNGDIVSYANRRWSDGGLYSTLGFELSHVSPPNYFYFKPGENILWSRNKFQKHKLHKLLAVFDENKTEYDNMFINDFRRIFDSGNHCFILKDRNMDLAI